MRKPALFARPELRIASAPAELQSLARLGSWAAAAATCLLVVAFATRTETGHRRLADAYGNITGAKQIAELERDNQRDRQLRQAEAEARRLSEALRQLSDDRDRLVVRLTAVERNFEDVTGSINQLRSLPKVQSPKEPSDDAGPASDAQAEPAASTPPPLDVAPVATIPVPNAERKPAAAQAPAALAPPTRSEFGVDLGGGPTIASLRNSWNQIRRQHGAMLEGLRPVVAVRDGRGGQAELRLVLGPIANAAHAAKLCTALAGAGLSCQPATFEGQRLAAR